MEYHVRLQQQPAALDRIESVLLDVDPGAVVDLDPTGQWLRVATTLRHPEVADCLKQAGLAIPADAIEVQPSTCCGSCSS